MIAPADAASAALILHTPPESVVTPGASPSSTAMSMPSSSAHALVSAGASSAGVAGSVSTSVTGGGTSSTGSGAEHPPNAATRVMAMMTMADLFTVCLSLDAQEARSVSAKRYSPPSGAVMVTPSPNRSERGTSILNESDPALWGARHVAYPSDLLTAGDRVADTCTVTTSERYTSGVRSEVRTTSGSSWQPSGIWSESAVPSTKMPR